MKLMNVCGIVLCGGRSRRMRQAKAWLPVGKETMLQRLVRVISQVVKPIVVVAAQGQDLPTLPAEVTIARDEIAGCGPLQGLAAGLKALRGQVDAAFVSGCDTPFLKPILISRLIECLGPAMACVPQVNGFYHPLTAVY